MRKKYKHLSEELIQTAAVCVAIVEFLEVGQTSASRTDEVLSCVKTERFMQDKKWGPQSHPLYTWMSILGEEFGESCQALLHAEFGSEHEEGDL